MTMKASFDSILESQIDQSSKRVSFSIAVSSAKA